MSRKDENTGFICENCGLVVLPLTNGGYRNHCPFYLYSKHVDTAPGDRKNRCQGLMKPVSLVYKPGKGYQIVLRCLSCGEESTNKVVENSVQIDDINELIRLF